jgi:multiple sugar transport system ATP-binding protein
MADKIVVLNGGKIEQTGTPMELYDHPATPFVAGFIGSPKMNLIEGEAARAFGCATYGIRPEHLSLSPDQGLWPATVRHVERLGADAVLHLATQSVGPLVARTAGDTTAKPGDRLFASPLPGKDHRFA